MTPNEINQRLTDIRNTLNIVSVAGADNMNRLLGCILLLDKLQPEIAALVQSETEEVIVDAADLDEQQPENAAMTRPEPEEEAIIDAADQTD